MSDQPSATPSTPATVFLTGGTTPLGRMVTELLVARRHPVVSLAHGIADTHTLRAHGITPVYLADASRPSEVASVLKMAQVNVIIHLEPQRANGLPVLRQDWAAVFPALEAHTVALLEAAKRVGVQFFAHTSYTFLLADAASGHDHGHGGHGRAHDVHAHDVHAPALQDEHSPTRDPQADPLVGEALEAEALVLHAGVPACVLRLGALYGGPEHDQLDALEAALRRGRPMVLGADGHTSFIRMDDAAAAIVAAATITQPAGQVLHITDGAPVPSSAFVTAFAESIGVRPPAALPRPLWPLALGRSGATVLGSNTRADAAAARTTLGWTPTYTSVRAGLDDLLLTRRARHAAPSR